MTLFQETSATGGKLWVGVYLAGVLRLPSGTERTQVLLVFLFRWSPRTTTKIKQIKNRGKSEMNILVCIKQVPDTTIIKIDPETNTLMREGVPAIVSPFDKVGGARVRLWCDYAHCVVSCWVESARLT